MAKPYKEGSGWSVRGSYRNHEIFISGSENPAVASVAFEERKRAIRQSGAPAHGGSKKTSLAQAMRLYGLEVLPSMKGAPQLVRRINRYLRTAHLAILELQPPAAASNHHFSVVISGQGAGERVIPNGLHGHRRALLNKTADSDKVRAVLSGMRLEKITRDDIQRLVDVLTREGVAPATIANERALLSALFSHAKVRWNWCAYADNPARQLRMPMVDNQRKRVLEATEQVLLDEVFAEAKNQTVRHLYVLLRETAMRASEPLLHATWKNVNWTSNILTLSDSKGGSREVPLSPVAIQTLKAMGPGKADEKIGNISYEALKAGMHRACVRAGVQDLHLHDLRRTAATRMGLKTGNQYIVKALTGHKTMAMVERYVNVKAADVVAVMHQPAPVEPPPLPLAQPDAVQGLSAAQLEALIAAAVANAMKAAMPPSGVQPVRHAGPSGNEASFGRAA